MGTGGGSVPPLKLRSWEEACRGLMDTSGLEGVGVAECGPEHSEDEAGSSQQPARPPLPPPKKRRTVAPLPPTLPASPSSDSCSPVGQGPASPRLSTSAPQAAHGPPTAAATVQPPPVAIATQEAPAAAVTGVGPAAQVTLTMVSLTTPGDTPPVPGSPDRHAVDAHRRWEQEVEESPNTCSIPYDHGDRTVHRDQEQDLGESPSAVLAEVLERVQRLEAASRKPSAFDTTMLQAMEHQANASDALVQALAAVADSDVEGAVGGLQKEVADLKKLVQVAETKRGADAKHQRTLTRGCINAIGTLKTATEDQTEQHRLNGIAAVTAIGELTAALRLLHPPPIVPLPLVPSTSTTPTRSSGTASTQATPPTSPVPAHALRRRRGARRGQP